MTDKNNLTVREACVSDRQSLANLIQFEVYVHRHLDWRQPLDWIGENPFFITLSGNEVLAAIACPTDPPHVAWIHSLAISEKLPLKNTWFTLWRTVKRYYEQRSSVTIAVIPRQDWFEFLLKESGFKLANQVLMLLWEGGEIPPARNIPGLIIRRMHFEDLTNVEALDTLAFDPIWRISELSLISAYRQAAYASVSEMNNKLVGYQISTISHHGGHLARLAVHPDFQRTGIGYNLVQDILVHLKQRGVHNISVNTQANNYSSLALYKQFGFQKTSEIIPTYQYAINTTHQNPE